jgi:hypothetical protein
VDPRRRGNLSSRAVTPLHAVALAGPDRAVPTIAELAARSGMATPLIVAPGPAPIASLVRRVAEHLHLGAVVLLLFQDAGEVAVFEGRLAVNGHGAG